MKIDYWITCYQNIVNNDWYKPIPFIDESSKDKFISLGDNYWTEALIKSAVDIKKTIKQMHDDIKKFLERQLLNDYTLEKLKLSIYYRVFAKEELLKILNGKKDINNEL